jgi:hypothetical protein
MSMEGRAMLTLPACEGCGKSMLLDETVVRAQEVVAVELLDNPHRSKAMLAGFHYFHVSCFDPSNARWVERGRAPFRSFPPAG